MYEGEATSLTSINAKGVFDVLPEHGNLIAAVSEYLLIHESAGRQVRLPITKGILRVEENKVVIFV